VSLYTKGQINYFIVRIAQNQFYSNTSKFHALFRKEQRGHVDASLFANTIADE
jgi:hypothetical protein